jgi:hypothetical protein
MMRGAARLRLVALLGLAGCAPRDVALRQPSNGPLDAVIIPGCPARADGRLSRCLLRRATWGAVLWARGVTRSFIVSGAATYNRYVEAEGLAAALVELGVPSSAIWMEQDARHTDENMYYALDIARRLGARRLAVASDAGQAAGGCSFLRSWGQPCLAIALDRDEVERWLDDPRHRAVHALRLDAVASDGWLPVDRFEAERAARGGKARPGSLALYFWHAPLGRLRSRPWVPAAPPTRELLRYSDYRAAQPRGRD